MKLSDLLSKLDYTLVQGSIDTDVTAVENDSRKVSEGSLFFCITGAVFDGHQYAKHMVHVVCSWPARSNHTTPCAWGGHTV